jgi:hypothetical protein
LAQGRRRRRRPPSLRPLRVRTCSRAAPGEPRSKPTMNPRPSLPSGGATRSFLTGVAAVKTRTPTGIRCEDSSRRCSPTITSGRSTTPSCWNSAASSASVGPGCWSRFERVFQRLRPIRWR